MTNTAVTLGVYSVALRLAVPYLPAGALAYALGAGNGFVLNRAWTFRVRGRPWRYLVVATVGGARTTFWNFFAMAVAAAVVLTASREKSLELFYVGFISLFVLSGVGNGSTYKMIPAIFRSKNQPRLEAGADPNDQRSGFTASIATVEPEVEAAAAA